MPQRALKKLPKSSQNPSKIEPRWKKKGIRNTTGFKTKMESKTTPIDGRSFPPEGPLGRPPKGQRSISKRSSGSSSKGFKSIMDLLTRSY